MLGFTSEIKILSMTSTPKNQEISIISLFGDEAEAFYQLGLKDRQGVDSSLHHINSLISTPWPIINSTIHGLGKNILDRITLPSNHYSLLLKSYSEGLQKDVKDVQFSLAVPEICAFFSLWAPNLKSINFGCSSFFSLDKNNNPIHTRILDFPLKDTYDSGERVIINSYKNRNKTISFSSCGQPFSGMTSMNDKGLTLGVHQKFTDNFNQHGQSIFYLLHELIHQCDDTKDALEFLKHHQSLTCWNFNLLDKNGKVLSADLSGGELHYKEYDIEDEPVYQCNELLNKDLDQNNFLPSGINEYNQQRKKAAKTIMNKLKDHEKLDKTDILKTITTPLNRKSYHISPVTLSSVACVSFSPNDQSVAFIPGEAPKICSGEIKTMSNVFDRYEVNVKKVRTSAQVYKTKLGLRHLSQAQSAFDLNDFSKCYHSLQMAQLSFSTPYLRAISHFYFAVVQYINEDHPIVLGHIQEELRNIYDDLSPYFKDLAKIIDQRICRLINSRITIDDEFSFENLKERFITESQASVTKHKILKKLTFLHIDVYDVIFL